MSSRKRPLAEVSQPHSTPVRYNPSTPHAIRALQQRSGTKARSARSTKHVNTDVVRPDSIRGVLRQLAKISAPLSKKYAATPSSYTLNKENLRLDDVQEDENDSVILSKPTLTFAIEESVDEDDSEILVAPTPSVLPDEDYDDEPTVTFQNVTYVPIARPASEHSDRRKSRVSLSYNGPSQIHEEEDQDADITMMTERGRRAVSEEVTGRLSRYSFGSIRMSDFGSELEVGRESENQEKTLPLDLDNYIPVGRDESLDGGDTEDIRRLRFSPPIDVGNETIHLSDVEDETFRLDVPPEEEVAHAREAPNRMPADGVILKDPTSEGAAHAQDDVVAEMDDEEISKSSRRQTMLETATARSQKSRQKRVKLTRHGTVVPTLPTTLVKRIVLNSYEKLSKRRPRLGRDHIKALEQATEWFLEQIGEDLAAYSSHGRRKKRVDVDDVLLLMRRQKVLVEDGELRKLAKNWLPKDILADLDLPDTT